MSWLDLVQMCMFYIMYKYKAIHVTYYKSDCSYVETSDSQEEIC